MAMNIMFRSGNIDHYTAARSNLKRCIIEVKGGYRRRIEDHLESNNSRQVWQGIQHLTKYKINLGAAEGDLALAEELNIFFAHFEAMVPDIQQQHAALQQHHPHRGRTQGEAHSAGR